MGEECPGGSRSSKPLLLRPTPAGRFLLSEKPRNYSARETRPVVRAEQEGTDQRGLRRVRVCPSLGLGLKTIRNFELRTSPTNELPGSYPSSAWAEHKHMLLCGAGWQTARRLVTAACSSADSSRGRLTIGRQFNQLPTYLLAGSITSRIPRRHTELRRARCSRYQIGTFPIEPGSDNFANLVTHPAAPRNPFDHPAP